MYLRRFYRRGLKHKRTYTDEYIQELIERLGEEETLNIDNAEYAIVLETPEEEKSWFFDCCQRVISNPRWYLNNLDKLQVFSVHIKHIFPEMIPDTGRKTERFINDDS